MTPKFGQLDRPTLDRQLYIHLYIYSAYQIKLPGMSNLLKYLLKAMFSMYEYRSNNKIRVGIS